MSLTRGQEDALKITITHGISPPETAGELGPEAARRLRLRRIMEAAAEAVMSSELLDDESIDRLLLTAAERVPLPRDQEERP